MNAPSTDCGDRVKTLVAELAQCYGIANVQESAPCATDNLYLPIGVAESRLATTKAWMQARAWRDRLIDSELFVDPLWDMMLDLYKSHHEGRRLTVTGACVATHVPMATACRQLTKLVEGGWVERRLDLQDRRRVLIALTAKAIMAMDNVMDHALAGDRALLTRQDMPEPARLGLVHEFKPPARPNGHAVIG